MLSYSSDRFSWNKKVGIGTSCASDLGLQVGSWPSQFYIKSSRTGETRLFIYYDKIITGPPVDVEIGGLVYICPGGGLTVKIFND